MQDVCWFHNRYFAPGEQCPDCLKLEESCKQSLSGEPVRELEERPSGLWNAAKLLIWLNLILWGFIILGAMILSKGR